MEIVLRDKKHELCIDHDSGCVAFTVLTDDARQMDFTLELGEWNQLKAFIDDSIDTYKQSQPTITVST